MAAALTDIGGHGFVFGLAGLSGSGKTTLAEKLIAALVSRGYRVASIKHAHHAFDPDTPGKDSWRHRKAGASQILVSSALRRVRFTETPEGDEAGLETLLAELAPADFVLVEGFKSVDFPKIEIWRQETGHDFLYPQHPGIKALASDTPLGDVSLGDCPLPVFDLNDTDAIADAVIKRLEK